MIDNKWIIQEVVDTPGVRHVVLSTADGLAKTWCESTSRDQADRLAATTAGLTSLGLQVGREYGQNTCAIDTGLFTFDGGHLFIRIAGEGSRLVVVASPQVDPRVVSQRMQELIQRLGQQTFSTPPRTASGT
ncbi:roadblock/LC7 domain-containing protein [Nonomuraea sp. NPDC004702]